jgi:glycosyltransferase involved in cell wall biosynthesis
MRYKRVDFLLEMFKQVLERVDAEFIIAGSGEELSRLRDYTRELGIGDKVKFAGWVSEREKMRLLSRAWVFVMASEREGFGLGALEAESCGTPVVALDVGGLGEAMKDGYSGFLIGREDGSRFADKVAALLLDARLRRRLSRNATAYSRRFDHSDAMRKLDRMMRGKQ